MAAGIRACLIPLLLAAIAAGCSPPGPAGEGGRKAGVEVPAAPAGPGDAPAPGPTATAGYLVTFSPAVPTAADNVRAVLRDAVTHREVQAGSWKWRVNGDGRKEESDTLPAGSAEKGDEIEALASAAGPVGTVSVRSRKVRLANAPPRVTGAGLSSHSPRRGDTLVATASAEDPDGDAVRLAFRWTVNGKVVQEGVRPELVLSSARRGDEVHCEVVPSDGESTGITLSTPVVTVLNSPPVIRSVPPASAGPAGAFLYRVAAEDPDGDDPGVELVEGPEGASFEGGTFRWEPPAGFRGTARVVLRATDGAGGEARQEFLLQAGEM